MTKTTVTDLQALNSMLEMGMWDNQRVQSLFDTLDSEPNALLPHAMNLVAWSAFLLTKVGRDPFALRILLACLAWSIENGKEKEEGPTLIGNIQHVLKKQGVQLDAGEIRRRAIERDYGNTESWVFKSN